MLQLDWPSETDTLKINLPQDWEGYYVQQIWIYVQKALDEAHPDPSFIFIFEGFFLKNNFPNNDNGASVPVQLDAPRKKL